MGTFECLIFYTVGIVLGIIGTKIWIGYKSSYAVFKIKKTNSQKTAYSLMFNADDLDRLLEKKQFILKVKNENNFSQK